MDIRVEKLSEAEIKKRGIKEWPIWTKGVARFPWTYDSTEECLILEGEVTVETADGKKVRFGAGDFVTFPEGLSCTWDIAKAVRKHYNFR
ncbi:MAG: cupin domain-containing protein [Deltaproteobacteria bacterium]